MAIQWLLDRMAEHGESPAVVWRDRVTSYRELLERVKTWDGRLDSSGIAAGNVVAVVGDFSPDTCALLLSLVNRRTIVVPLTTAVREHWEEFLETSHVQWVLTVNEDESWRLDQRPNAGTHAFIDELRARGAPGLVLFSSGSTGRNKAVLNDFGKLMEKFKVPRHRLVTMSFLLFDHIGGVNTLFYTFSNGGTVVTTGSRDSEEVCRLIERHRVELLPTTPTFLNLLLMSEAHRTRDLSSLQLITYGTEVMPDSTLARVHEAFPNVRLQQTYGLSELGILRTKSRSSDSAWVKVGGEGIETRVVDGTLRVRAPSAMLGYLNAPNAVDADGWMDTEDLVDVDGDYVRFLGRKSQIINVGGSKVYPAEVESVLLQMKNVADATVYAKANAITGQVVAARVALKEPADPAEFKRELRAFCRSHLPATKVPVVIEIADEALHSARLKKKRNL